MKHLAMLVVRTFSLLVLILLGSLSSLAPSRTHTALHFVAQQHVLNFRAGEWSVSNGTDALRVAFVNANAVMPTSETGSALTRVVYGNVWNGIEVSYRAAQGGIVESVYAIAPQADVKAIRLRYNAPVRVNGDGTLTTLLKTGQVTESAPVAWQEMNGERVGVPVSFVMEGEEVAFAMGAYDSERALYIDPTLTWNTFLGSSANDAGNAVAVDSTGNVYVVGNSDATWGAGVSPQGCAGCPKRAYSAKQDVFVAKLDANGNLIWNTFLGGTETDAGTGVTVDGSGNVYVSGNSGASWGSPKRAFDASVDTFAAKLDTNGNLLWNTFLGGRFADLAGGIAVDATPSVYVTGASNGTWGSPVRAYTLNDDGFAVKLDSSDGTMLWNTFLGGSDEDEALDITADSTGTNVYVGGSSRATWGTGAPPQGCAGCPLRAFSVTADGFAAKLSSAGALVWNTFLGGTANDSIGGITVDGSGNVYVGGTSDGTWGTGDCAGCPVRAYSAGNDAFAAKLSSAGGLTWNSFVGGSGTDLGSGIAVNGAGTRVVVGGVSTATWGAPFRAFTGGGADSFAAELNSTGALSWNGFLGGTGTDSFGGVDTDSNANVYVTGSGDASWGTGAPPQGCTGCPIRAYTPNAPSPVDAFVAKITDPTTAVNVAGLSGRVGASGKVVLKWQTTAETEIAGFRVYRRLGTGDWRMETRDLIQAKHAGDAAGARYRFKDVNVREGASYRYKVQVVYLDGHMEWTDVVGVTVR